jgi:hypothetical protein
MVPAGRAIAAQRAGAAQARDDGRGLVHQPFARQTGDALSYELVPGYAGEYKGAAFRTNRWGMRDKNYELKAPKGTYRMALLGSSFSMGGGVAAEQTFEALLENRLNVASTGSPSRGYEILNFSVGGYGVLQNLAVLERKVFQFEPDAVLLVVHSVESGRVLSVLQHAVRTGVQLEYPYIRQKLKESGVRADMEEPELRRRLGPVSIDVAKWSYQRIAKLCKDRGVPLVGIAFPALRKEEDRLDAMVALASEANIPMVSLEGVYAGHAPSSIALPRDAHLNAAGHKLVADRLYELLRKNPGGLKIGTEARR